MKKFFFISLLFLHTLAWYSCTLEGPEEHAFSPSTLVDPFIGTADHGHVYPGATVPFGAIQLSPDNGTAGWDWCSGYNWADDKIVGFSHTHLSGTGIGDLMDISMMPATGRIDFSKKTAPRASSYASTFSHDKEAASPGYYEVTLDNGIEVALTATTHAGLHHYTFPAGSTPTVLLDLGFAINWDRPLETSLVVQSPTRVTGYRYSTGWARDQRLFFALEFSKPVNSYTIADSTALVVSVPDYDSLATELADLDYLPSDWYHTGRQLRAQFNFSESLNNNKELLVKVGISSADEAGALAALATIPDWDFDGVHAKAAAAWAAELSKISVKSTDEALKKTFYTALYRTALAPVTYSDPNGSYKASTSGASANWSSTPPYPDGTQLKKAQGYTRYDIFSLWDTFRAANPLFTITQPDLINDFIQSLLAHYDEYGRLPVWSLLGNETNTMTGYHAIPVIVDAYMKGFRGYDVDKIYQAMKASAMQEIRGTDLYRQYGYIPYDKAGQSVTRTLEYAYDDWCIAQLAKALGQEDDYELFMKRAASYRHFFDPTNGFMRAKLSDGSWKKPFDPQYSSHDFAIAEYTEGNAWQHSWFVPHDVQGLINLHGGNEAFITKLDSLFSVSSEIRGEFASADISGLIGQYAHGNEPSHHIAYLYNYAGAPWKTQEKVHEIMTTQYNATPTGLCGNEDCGQMSAWYVFSALGFYPVNPAEGIYVIGTPSFETAVVKTGEGKQFKILAEGVSADNIYIQSATLNGEPLERAFITHEELMNGGELVFVMGNKPNTGLWITAESAPPSMTQ